MAPIALIISLLNDKLRRLGHLARRTAPVSAATPAFALVGEITLFEFIS